MAEIKRHSAHDAISERLYDSEARLSTIIFLPAAHDGENAIEALSDFISEEIFEGGVAKEFDLIWPNFSDLFKRFGLGDADQAEVLDFLQHNCPVPFLVKAEFTVKECLIRHSDDEYPCGTWRSGWGMSSWQWLLAESVEAACDRAGVLAEEQKRKAWDSRKPKKAARTAVANDK
ncbi:MAG: hypothetical protein ABL934_09690 [Lysobacteraceae bacterium]